MSEFAILSIGGIKSQLGEVGFLSENRIQVELPKTFTKADVARAQKDCEIIEKILKSQPQKVLDLLQAAKSNEREKAHRMAKELGLTENSFLAQEGAAIGCLVIVIIIILLLVASEAN